MTGESQAPSRSQTSGAPSSGARTAPTESERLRDWAGSQLFRARRATLVVAAMLALLWLVQAINLLAGNRLAGRFGIEPRHVASLPEIVFAPLFHVSCQHLAGNSLPLAVLGFLVAMRGLRRFAAVTAVVVVLGGAALWAFGPTGSDTVGASGLIFGYFGYLLLCGLFERSLVGVLLGLCVGSYYGWFFLIAVPSSRVATGVSWQGHLFGLCAGALAAWALTAWARRFQPPPPLIAVVAAPAARTGTAASTVGATARVPSR